MTTEQRAGLTDLLRYAAERTDREDLPQTSEDTSVFFDGARWATARLRAIADEVGRPTDGWNDERLTALVNACHDEVRQELLGTELNPSTLAEDAAAYGRLRDAIAATMDDPDRWDGDESEDEILARYVKWLADGKPTQDEEETPALHLAVPRSGAGEWWERLDVAEALESAGWSGDDDEHTLLRKNGAIWGITNECDDSSLTCPNGATFDFPSDTPSVVVIAACLAAAADHGNEEA